MQNASAQSQNFAKKILTSEIVYKHQEEQAGTATKSTNPFLQSTDGAYRNIKPEGLKKLLLSLTLSPSICLHF